MEIWGLLHKTITGEKTPVKSENSGTHNFNIDFTIGKKSFSPVKVLRNGPWSACTCVILPLRRR